MNNPDYILALKALRRERRLLEIEAHGHPVCACRVQESKKRYTRKQKHKQPW